MTKEASPETVEADDILMKLGPVTHYLSTGCTLLDLAIADRLPGGFAAGRIAQIYGAESVAKTIIGLEPLGSAQRQGGRARFNDVEGTLDESRMGLFGVSANAKHWKRVASSSIEDLFDVEIPKAIAMAQECKAPCAETIDSLSALCSIAEQKVKLKDATMGMSRAKQLSAAFRKYLHAINSAKLALIFIDQTRTNVGQTYGDASTTSGGAALKFYASTRLKLSMIEKITNSNGRVIGVKIGVLVKKNKIAAPFRECDFHLLFDYGIDDVSSSLDWLHNNDPAQLAALEKDTDKEEEADDVRERKDEKKKRQKWVFKDLTARGLNDLAKQIEDKNLEKSLVQEVERVWRLVYAPLERKTRERFGN